MISVSVMIKDNPWMKPGAGHIGNLLLVRKNVDDAKADLEYVIGLGGVLGWAMFDGNGHATEASNGGMCLTWANDRFDSIDVFYGRRY